MYKADDIKKTTALLSCLFAFLLMQPSSAHACYCGGTLSFLPLLQLEGTVQTARNFVGRHFKIYEASFASSANRNNASKIINLKVKDSFPFISAHINIPNTAYPNTLHLVWRFYAEVESVPGAPFQMKSIFRDVRIRLKKQANDLVSSKLLSRGDKYLLVHISPGLTHTTLKIRTKLSRISKYALTAFLSHKDKGILAIKTHQGNTRHPCGNRTIYVKDQARAIELDWLKNQKAWCGFQYKENQIRFAKKQKKQPQAQTEEK